MIISALSGRLLRTARRLAPFVRRWPVSSSLNAIIYLGSVDPDGCDRFLLNLRRAAMRVTALAVFMAITSVTHAVAQQVSGNVTGLNEDLTKWSPELVGRQWGWRLTRYKSFDASFKIDGEVYLMLSADIKTTDNVIWDPLTGLGRHFDHDQWVEFTDMHREDLFSGILSIGQHAAMSDGRIMEVSPAPGVGMPSCSQNFNGYYNIYDSSRRLLRSFYVVERVVDPLSVRYHICIEGSGDHVFIKPKRLTRIDLGIFCRVISMR